MRFAICFLIVSLFISCASTATIPADVTEKQIQQQGQAAIDRGNYKQAIAIYEEMIKRFGDNLSSRISAEFELAHISLKKRKWTEAKARLESILLYYETQPFGLPNEYRKLAENDLKTVEEKLSGKQKAPKPVKLPKQPRKKAAEKTK